MSKLNTLKGTPHNLVGSKVVEVRPLTNAEMAREGWEGQSTPIALVLDNGSVLYPSRDGEGNGPGKMFESKGGTLAMLA